MDSELAELEYERQDYMKERLREIEEGKMTIRRRLELNNGAVEIIKKQSEIINQINIIAQEKTDRMQEAMKEAVTQYEKAEVMNDYLTAILDNVNSKIEVEEFEDINVDIKPL